MKDIPVSVGKRALRSASNAVKSPSDIKRHRTITLLLDDVKNIINSIPAGHPDKCEEASLYLLASFTGCRPISATSITLQDIQQFYYEGKEYHIVINISKIILL